MSDKTIQIRCQGAITVDIDDVKPLQGTLKTLMEGEYDKLRKSIEELGFSDPLSIWIDADGTKWVHDGHERILTLKKMRMDGYTIPPLPASIIEAKDKTEAKKKLLANDSRYGKIDSAGLTEFLNEEDSPIDEDELSDILELPEIDFETGEEEDEPSTHIAEPKEIECPACHEKFVPKK
jgi:ParB-like chromosome segregation protein Spo0J